MWIGALNLAYCFVEFVGAIKFGSLALLVDAFHNLGDFGNVLIAWYCERWKTRTDFGAYTFGYDRAEVLGAIINSGGR